MERMQLQLQGPIASSSLWAEDKQQAVSSTAAAQMPFLALLQGAGVVMEAEQQHHDGRKRQQALARAAVSDLDLLESCVTHAAVAPLPPPPPAACAPVATTSRTDQRRRTTKRPRRGGGTGAAAAVGTAAASASDGVFVSPQYASYSDARGAGMDVEATAAVGGHVRVRVAGRRWPGRLVRVVAALEDLRLAVLHLAVTSVGRDAVVYCFNLKMEEGCEVATADEVATVVHQIFAYAAGACC